MMETGIYFDEHLSMATRTGNRPVEALAVVAERYMACHPRHPVTFRAFSKRGIQRNRDYRYVADFNRFFPDAEDGASVYAWARMWSAADADLLFDLYCYGPVQLDLNGEMTWRSDLFAERYPDRYNRIRLQLRRGWNTFVLRAQKTRGGFGWEFGSWIGKHPYVFMMPSKERTGQEGWLFTDPLTTGISLPPRSGMSEQETGMRWNPVDTWPPDAPASGNCGRIFGAASARTVVAWTRVRNGGHEAFMAALSGQHLGGARVLLDGREIQSAVTSGTFGGAIELKPGEHDLMVLSTGSTDGWGFELTLQGPDGEMATQCPCDLQGSDATWLYAGPFEPDRLPDPETITDFLTVHDTVDGPGYWRLDEPETWLRLYNENPLFGHWNYPLGVTLYGLFHAGKAIGSETVTAYVRGHVQFCCDSYPYSVWDRENFGGATHVHHLLAGIDSLDDCGSFGSTMLEVAQHGGISGYESIAQIVGDYISNRQARFPDGAFQRREMMHAFHNNTMWADDLYMSVPFLCRYYRLTGDPRYIDDAANQFFGFRKRLYMPEQRLMSHVFDIGRDVATGVPWGRGNGWTLFSLSELLAVLPENHNARPELLAFYRELSSGILAQQDAGGMWHQVLTLPDSYPETSCTAMFVCAFSRGVRQGWLEQQETYVEAVLQAWEALNRMAIDREGNIYGVCRGSEFSFSPDYYKDELPWSLNDTHGIGIVLLAGVEVIKLTACRKDSAGGLKEAE